jgi:hypothetical protein
MLAVALPDTLCNVRVTTMGAWSMIDSALRTVRRLSLRVNFALPKPMRLLNTVLVLTSEWQSSSPYIRYFPDNGCLDMSSGNQIARNRLHDGVPMPPRADCENHVTFEVTQCTVV